MAVGAELDKHVLVIKFAQPKKAPAGAASVPKVKGPNAIQKKKNKPLKKRLVVTKKPGGGGKVLLSDRFAKRRVHIV